MNCKPGDLAVIVGTSTIYQGMLVDVLYSAPLQEFILPDGRKHMPAKDEKDWLVQFQRPITAPTGKGGIKTGEVITLYGVVHDDHLRPIRDQPGEDETLSWASLPSPTPIKETA